MTSPFLIGVEHRGENAIAVIDEILRLGVKSVGFECPPDVLQLEPAQVAAKYGLRSHHMFWVFVAMRLKEKGVRVEPLVSQSFHSKALLLQKKGEWINQAKKEDVLKTPSEIMVFSILPTLLKRNAIKKKVEALVCGAPHAFLLRKEMNIPKNHFLIIHRPHIPRMAVVSYSLERLRATRRYRRNQRNARKSRKNP